ncbi:DNA cytosine methyltransferase [Undibacterium sp. Dicai25W]|uniref:DNA cytosine methyltransferase n=1 Tax=Undibacterium sp. Dicai25W TaxID=3413034 RepID=UPI003BF053F2
MEKKLKIVDLFCGCGGFGLGAKQAEFDVVAAVDIDTTLQSAYRLNFPKTRVLNGDLSKMDKDAWHLILGDEKIDGVIGGPPCQGYSRMGKGDVNDPRRSLLYHFFRTINIIQPSFFVMENVEGLLDEGNIEELQKAIATADRKYTILPPIILDASKYGVPTKRKRVVVIGYVAQIFEKITEDDLIAAQQPSVTVKDAIQDIPEPVPQSKDKGNLGWSKYREIGSVSSYAAKMRSAPPENMGSPEAIEMLARGYTSGNFETIHTDLVKQRYEATKPGEVDKVSRAKKLAWNGLCPTLRAGTGVDKGSHQAVRPLHPEAARVITVREAARLQGFPDWFCFHSAKWHSFRMIGNSVSPIVSEAILKLLQKKLSIKSHQKIERSARKRNG